MILLRRSLSKYPKTVTYLRRCAMLYSCIHQTAEGLYFNNCLEVGELTIAKLHNSCTIHNFKQLPQQLHYEKKCMITQDEVTP